MNSGLLRKRIKFIAETLGVETKKAEELYFEIPEEAWKSIMGRLKLDVTEWNKVKYQENESELCDACGNILMLRFGRNGPFLGCNNYPDCNFTKSPFINEGVPNKEVVTAKIAAACDFIRVCGSIDAAKHTLNAVATLGIA